MSSPSETTPTQTTNAILAIPAANAAVPPPSDPPPRKFPAPCWTHDETLALITSYQDKWYSLRRRNLKTIDWESVADEVNRLCPDQSLPKTSAQCRHKMEKLRKRYRAEKQRINSLIGSGNFSEKRFFGSSWVFYHLIDNMELGPGGSGSNIGNGFSNCNDNNNINSNNLESDNVDVKPFRMNDDKKYFDDVLMSMNGSRNHEFDMRSTAPHIKFKVKNHHQQHHYNHGGVGSDFNDDFDDGDEYVGGGGGVKRKCDERFSSRMMPMNGSGARGEETVVGEMVASIKMLGEGFVKMEKMKMEMMRDIEKMRMEMEMKRSEMILESQHLIVNAFVEGIKKHKKVKVMEIE